MDWERDNERVLRYQYYVAAAAAAAPALTYYAELPTRLRTDRTESAVGAYVDPTFAACLLHG